MSDNPWGEEQYVSKEDLERHNLERATVKWADLFGIDPNYTDGQDIGEWLEEQRGEA